MVRGMRRLAVVVTVFSIALSGCGDGDTVPAEQSPSTRPEQVNEVEGDDEVPEPTEGEEDDAG